MNLIQKIVKKAKEKIDELLLIRKVKNIIECKIIEQEEIIISHERRIKESLEDSQVETAMVVWKAMENAKNNIKLLEKFKNYVLNDEKNEGCYTVL